MTQGLFINGRRPKSKKEVREFIDAAYLSQVRNPGAFLDYIRIEATSWFGNVYDGPLSDNERTNPITFVGPDPHTKRNFFGRIEFSQKKGRWIVS